MKKRKTDVYVTVDSPKVAKKLKKVLDMFGETLSSSDTIEFCINEGCVIHFWRGNWCATYEDFQSEKGKTKVTVSELKQILFREHAKEWDVVVADCGGDTRYVVDVKSVDNYRDYIDGNKYVRIANDATIQSGGSFRNFIRYATEEEKALLNPVKELDCKIGDWVIVDSGSYYSPTCVDAIVCYQNNDMSYGFNHEGKWTENYNTANGHFKKDYKRLATPREVEAALIKEAKRRYKVGDIVNCVDGYEQKVLGIDYCFSNYCLYSNGERTNGGDWYNLSRLIFQDGQWAEVVEPVCELVATVKGTDVKPKFEVTIDTKKLEESINKTKATILITEIEQKLEQLKKLV